MAQQFVNLRSNPICAGIGELRAGRLLWRYCTSPTPMSRTYRMRVDYRRNDVPQVFVEEPDLVGLAGDRRLPHVYKQRPTRLCLWLSRTHEWSAWMRIDQTVVPWAALWLFYFEEWLDSDEWKGGGVHPGRPRSQ